MLKKKMGVNEEREIHSAEGVEVSVVIISSNDNVSTLLFLASK